MKRIVVSMLMGLAMVSCFAQTSGQLRPDQVQISGPELEQFKAQARAAAQPHIDAQRASFPQQLATPQADPKAEENRQALIKAIQILNQRPAVANQ